MEEKSRETASLTEKEGGIYFYDKAMSYAQKKNVASSVCCYVDAFLLRGKEAHCCDKDWLDFFRMQFTIYLLGKKQICCSLSEGDMIHDYLREVYQELRKTWKESELPFHGDLYNWFSSLELDFPWIVDTQEPQLFLN